MNQHLRVDRRLFAITGVTVALAVGAAVVAPTASAAEAKRTGTCSAGSSWEADAEHDDGGIEVDWEVKTRQVGVRWIATISHNGSRVLKDVGITTRDHDRGYRASTDWDLDQPDEPGADRFVLRAQNIATGEVCRAELVL